jgi:hypothetical protein
VPFAGPPPRWNPPIPKGPPHGEFGVTPKRIVWPSLGIIAFVLVLIGGFKLAGADLPPGSTNQQLTLLVFAAACLVGLALLVGFGALRRFNTEVGEVGPGPGMPKPMSAPPVAKAAPPAAIEQPAEAADPAPEAAAATDDPAGTDLAKVLDDALTGDEALQPLLQQPRLRFAAGLYALGAADAVTALRAPGTDPTTLLLPALLRLGFQADRAQRLLAEVALLRDPPRYAQVVSAGSRATVEALAGRPSDPSLTRTLQAYERAERPADALVVLASNAVEVEASESRRTNLRRIHDRMLEGAAATRGGLLLNAEIDGERQFAFSTLANALLCISDLQRLVRDRALETGADDLRVRVALASGLPSPEAPDQPPSTSRLIARALAASAMPSETLVSDAIAETLLASAGDGLPDTNLLGPRRTVVVDAGMEGQGVRVLMAVPTVARAEAAAAA